MYEYTAFKFSTGYTWFYWEYFKNGGNVLQFPGNADDYGGYTEQELYVNRKYADFKEEILSHLGIKSYDQQIMVKAHEYMNMKKVKSMKAPKSVDSYLHYGITEGMPITIHHIISLILYCDFSVFCTNFGRTFRALSFTETMQDVKKRNSAFWWQSKYMREAVEIYGYDANIRKREKGPFYTGIQAELCIPQFAIRLNAPTSTSKQIAVSVKFAKVKGMIIELNNTGHRIAAYLPFLDVSWLSRFPDEDERVFIGMVH